MHTPSIARFMTKQPWTIARSATLAEAHRMMREHRIRHLPVVDGGSLVGILSRGDLHLLETVAEFSLEEVSVDEAMTERPFVVPGDTPLEEVVAIMADHKYGSAIIAGREGVEGIFTTTDACRALVSVLQQSTAESLGLSRPS